MSWCLIVFCYACKHSICMDDCDCCGDCSVCMCACVFSAQNHASMIIHWIALHYFWSFLSVKRTYTHIKILSSCPSSVMLLVKFLHIDGGKEKETVLMVSTGPILQRLAQRLWSIPTLHAHDWRFIWTESPCYFLINQKAQCLSYQLIVFILITGWRAGRLILRRNGPLTAGRLMLITLFAEPGETICLQALPALRLRASDTSNPPNPSCGSSYLYQMQSHSDKRHLFRAFIYQRLPRSVMDSEMENILL